MIAVTTERTRRALQVRVGKIQAKTDLFCAFRIVILLSLNYAKIKNFNKYHSLYIDLGCA